jgi:Bacterial TSP3 repeat
MKTRFSLSVLASTVLFTLASAITYNEWLAAGFSEEQLNDEAFSGVTADPDGDGISNLAEYAFNGHPLIVDSDLQTVAQTISGHITVTYRERQGMTDVSIRLQGSDTLQNWITYNTVTQADRVVVTGYDEVTLLDPVPFTSKRFVRLQINLLPTYEPRAPEQLALAVDIPTAFTLTWTDPNATETGYALERRLSNLTWERLAYVSSDTGDWQHMAANYKISMTYRVVALSAGGQEAASAPVTLADTDGDGIPDGLELKNSYTGVAGTYATDPNQFSSNGSGVSDGWLADNGFDPAAPFDGEADTDGDGIPNAEEARRGTNPHATDTDGDGVPDAEDGWPNQSWITVAPLAETSYMIVPLADLGWNSSRSADWISDTLSVVSRDAKLGDSNYYFSPFPAPSFSSPARYLSSNATLLSLMVNNNVDYNVNINPRNVWNFIYRDWHKPLDLEGRYIGGVFTNDSLQAALIDPSGTAQIITFSQPPPESPTNQSLVFRSSYAQSVNKSRDTTTLEVKSFREQSPPPGQPNERTNMVAGFLHKSNGEEILLGEWARAGTKRIGPYALETFAEGDYVIPHKINNERVIAFVKRTGLQVTNFGLWKDGTFINLNEFSGRPPIEFLTDKIPGSPTFAGYKDSQYKQKIIYETASNGWAHDELFIWDTDQQKNKTTSISTANNRLEMISSGGLIRNGIYKAAHLLGNSNWSIGNLADINNHGVILATGTRVRNDQGQPVTNPQSEPVLLLPIELTSEDRLVKGAITIPESWTNVSLSFRSTAQGGLDLGTFAGLEPGVTDSPTYIYASEDEILSETELDQAQSGTLDPRANTQGVVFYRDAENPRLLHFATAFDQVGEIEIALSFGSGAIAATAKLKHTLTAESETAGLIGTLDQRIQSIDIPEVIDFDLDTDGDGIPDGGPADLITASQPGTMAAPGAFVSETAEDDPLNLVLLVNSDDDNTDLLPDAAATALDASDDDLARIVLRAPSSLSSPVGTLTLTHNGGPALRLRFATGPPVASGTSVNLAAPSGVLAGLTTGAVTLYAEGLAPTGNVAITLTYTPTTGNPVADTVHLTVLDPASLASLQTRHRYFALPGDLGGIVSRSYAANGAYRQHRLGLAPIGANLPIQNRNLLAKSLFSVIGSLKNTAAFYRGVPDGFWLGLKGDWQSIQDTGEAIGSAIAFVMVEDNVGRMARAVAFYDQIREIKKAFDGVSVRDIPGIMGNMASTITRDLYTEAEASLGWEPITDGLDAQVINYMAGITVGYVGEQVVIGLTTGAAAAKITTKIAPMVRGLVAAVISKTTYPLEALDDVAKPASWLSRGVQKTARTQDETKAMVQAVQKVKRFEFPDGFTVPRVINDWFKLKPQLYDELLTIWVNKFPADVSGQRVANMMNDLASVLHRFGNNPALSDDAVKGFAHLQAKLFKVGEDNLSRWKDMENLFGGLNTPAKRAAMDECLIAYKQAAELNPAAKFWLKNFSAVSSEAYHYAPNLKRLEGSGSFLLSAYQGERGWYVTTSKFDEIGEAAGKLQLPELENARYRIKFATSETEGHLKLPKGWQNVEPHFEPLTRDFPDLGPGAAPQMLLENKTASVLEIYDTVAGRTLTTSEIQDLIDL